ncbi:adenylate kinase [Perkinsus chesapeaki]|uniref:Adenylate kinase n=1 Tax=Perkinsus chesapeaki TaxID=330153 RepID=A0A7J6N5F8_PERCH|nr:adenylate kinase [Perkinsus chesapeaki]
MTSRPSPSLSGLLEATSIGPGGQRSLHSFLSEGVVELFKNRPTNSIDAARFLAQWMESNNPDNAKPVAGSTNESSQQKEEVTLNSESIADRLVDKLSGVEVISGDASSVTRSATDPLSSSNPFVVFVLGGPGCGKGTNCARISKEFGFIHLSTGDLLRDEVKKGSDLGKEAKAIMEQGLLLDDSIVLRLLKNAMVAAVLDGRGNKFLVDGYPRSLEQARMFEKEICTVSLVLYFDASDKAMTERILERGKTSGRVDDNIETIGKRLQTFHNCTEPVVSFYDCLGKLRKVPADGTLDEVYSLAQWVFQPKALEAVLELNLFEKKRDPFVPLCGGRENLSVVFVLGGPGCGKGTNCARIREDFGYVHLSTGDLLREEVGKESPIGLEAKAIMEQGGLISDAIVLKLLEQAMLDAVNEQKCTRFLIDGYPRSLEQALLFERTICPVNFVLYFEASDEVMTERILERGKTSGRVDDNSETIKKRLETFHASTEPALAFYEQISRVRRVCAHGTLDEVYNLAKPYFLPNVLCIVGGQGSGKRDIARILHGSFGYKAVHAGDLLRQVPSGQPAVECGEIADASLIGPLVVEELKRLYRVAGGAANFVVVGYPRTQQQMSFLEDQFLGRYRIISLRNRKLGELINAATKASSTVGSSFESIQRAAESIHSGPEMKALLEKYSDIATTASVVPGENTSEQVVKNLVKPKLTVVVSHEEDNSHKIAETLAGADGRVLLSIDKIVDAEVARSTLKGRRLFALKEANQRAPSGIVAQILIETVMNRTVGQRDLCLECPKEGLAETVAVLKHYLIVDRVVFTQSTSVDGKLVRQLRDHAGENICVVKQGDDGGMVSALRLPESLLIVGPPYVGKSSFAEALVNGVKNSFVVSLKRAAEFALENLDGVSPQVRDALSPEGPGIEAAPTEVKANLIANYIVSQAGGRTVIFDDYPFDAQNASLIFCNATRVPRKAFVLESSPGLLRARAEQALEADFNEEAYDKAQEDSRTILASLQEYLEATGVDLERIDVSSGNPVTKEASGMATVTNKIIKGTIRPSATIIISNLDASKIMDIADDIAPYNTSILDGRCCGCSSSLLSGAQIAHGDTVLVCGFLEQVKKDYPTARDLLDSFEESIGAESMVNNLMEVGCQVFVVCYPSSASSPLGLEGNNLSVIRCDDRNVAVAAIRAFAPELVLILPHLFWYPREELSAYPIWELRYAGTSIRQDMWPEYDMIIDSRCEVCVELTCDERIIGSMGVSVNGETETALTLRQKLLEACQSLLCNQVIPLLGATEDDSQSMGYPSGVVGLEVSESSDREVVSAHIRAMNFPPYSDGIPLRVTGVEGPDFLVDYPEQFDRIIKAAKDGIRCTQPDIRSSSRTTPGFAADTHFYSNIGGSIVKVSGVGNCGTGLDDIPRTEGHCDVIPGSAISDRIPKKLRMNEPFIGPNAGLYISRALGSGWIGVEGPWVKKFERKIASICGGRAACAVQSGTAALYGAMKALGVSNPEHFVICPAFTCAACADAVVHAGGTPLICDVEEDSYALSYQAVLNALDHPVHGPKIVGMIVAPCYGVPARDYLKLVNLSRDRSIWLCEDNCESYGATVVDETGSRVRLGSLGTISVVSVRSEKMVGVGEGGAIISNNVSLVAAARWWCSRAPCVGQGLWHVYNHESVGQNFRMPELLGCVGVAAAEMLPTMLSRKRAIHGWYEEHLADLSKSEMISLQQYEPTCQPVWWLNAVFLKNQSVRGEEIGTELMRIAPEVEIRPGFYPLGLMKPFRGEEALACPVAELLYERILCLPSSHNLTESDVKHVCDTLRVAVHNVTSLSNSKLAHGPRAMAA